MRISFSDIFCQVMKRLLQQIFNTLNTASGFTRQSVGAEVPARQGNTGKQIVGEPFYGI